MKIKRLIRLRIDYKRACIDFYNDKSIKVCRTYFRYDNSFIPYITFKGLKVSLEGDFLRELEALFKRNRFELIERD